MGSVRLTLVCLLTVGVAAMAMLILASCGGDDDETTTSATTEQSPATETEASGSEPAPSGDTALTEKVEIVDFVYDPDPVKIEEGGKVIWINRDSAPHTATADDNGFDTGTLDEGKLKSENFKDPGKYKYFCEIHPEMKGTVEVVAAE